MTGDPATPHHLTPASLAYGRTETADTVVSVTPQAPASVDSTDPIGTLVILGAVLVAWLVTALGFVLGG